MSTVFFTIRGDPRWSVVSSGGIKVLSPASMAGLPASGGAVGIVVPSSIVGPPLFPRAERSGSWPGGILPCEPGRKFVWVASLTRQDPRCLTPYIGSYCIVIVGDYGVVQLCRSGRVVVESAAAAVGTCARRRVLRNGAATDNQCAVVVYAATLVWTRVCPVSVYCAVDDCYDATAPFRGASGFVAISNPPPPFPEIVLLSTVRSLP